MFQQKNCWYGQKSKDFHNNDNDMNNNSWCFFSKL